MRGRPDADHPAEREAAEGRTLDTEPVQQRQSVNGPVRAIV